MINLHIDDMTEIQDMIIIHVCDLPCFDGKFSDDRYGDRAIIKANEFGNSCLDRDIKINDNIYMIEKFRLMMGSCSYVSSIIFKLERL